MNAQQAIKKIKDEKVIFMGQIVQRYNYDVEVREQLQKMAQKNEINPSEYRLALKITFCSMSAAEKEYELNSLD